MTTLFFAHNHTCPGDLDAGTPCGAPVGPFIIQQKGHDLEVDSGPSTCKACGSLINWTTVLQSVRPHVEGALDDRGEEADRDGEE